MNELTGDRKEVEEKKSTAAFAYILPLALIYLVESSAVWESACCLAAEQLSCCSGGLYPGTPPRKGLGQHCSQTAGFWFFLYP